MEIIADLHLHSRFSRAVSQQMVLPEIAKWVARKGINLVGTGDWTHPLWFRELKEKLEEAKEGIYRLKGSSSQVFFLLSTEISSIYSQGGQSHRIHNLIFAPNLSVVEEINNKLRSYGVNLLSDGRPITGLSSQQICELVFSIDKNCLVIPAHAWTPWYSLYGSNSGFDSLQECFGEFADQIKAIETGLSSDPGMNWRIAELDNRSLVSFSDAHSPQKLGRETTLFDLEANFNYQQFKEALVSEKIVSTIEFYPEEGKYHWTGHRSCQVKQSPEQTKKLGSICPVCGRKLTIGVMHRVEQLATRPADFQPEKRPPYKMLVPLVEILAEVKNSSVSSQNVENEYLRLTTEFGSEFNFLLKTSLEEIKKAGGERLAEGIDKVRRGDIFIDPGYDGVFGKVKIWPVETEKSEAKEQMSLF
jgi:uncharacterized protein (TIGR00375 family)